MPTPASRKLLNLTKAALESAEAEIERLRAALESTREAIALFYALEALSDEGKTQLLKLRDRIDEALADEQKP